MKLIVFLVAFSVSFSLACLNCRRRKTCEDDTWTLINRTLGGWCVKAIAGTATNYTSVEAAETCNELGAVLSSIESEAEMEIELNLVAAQGFQVAILGSQLKPECACSDFTDYYDRCYFNTTTNCTESTAFEWTDNFTVGDSMMSNVDPGYGNDYYYQLLVLYSNGIWINSDVRFETFESEGLLTLGALCGKKAT